MIRELLDDAHRLDALLQARIGRPYYALLGVGLVAEFVKHLREFGDLGESATGIVGTALALLMFAALLLHQLGELREHAERRGESGRGFERRK
jgi:hypothetical protein